MTPPPTPSAIRLTIADLDAEGAGAGNLRAASTHPDAELEVHVRGALPGEEVEALVTHRSPHRRAAWADLTKVLQASPSRVAPACAAHGRCGGCALQHLDYRAQLAWKEARFARLAAGYQVPGGLAIAPAVASPRSLGYRNNSKLVAGTGAGSDAVVLGGYAPGSHDLVDLDGCRIVEPPLERVAATLARLASARGIAPYDERRLTGTLRYAVLRASAAGEVLVTLVIARDTFPQGAALADELRAAHPEVAGVVENVNLTRGNVIFGDRERTIAGSAALEDAVGPVRLRVSSRSFFQANRDVAALAYAAIADAAALSGSETVVDAYAGVGGIALTLAPRAARVIGIEQHAAAVEDAGWSAAANGVGNARFVAGDVATCLAEAGTADVVVLNPPRRGCAPDVLRATAALGPRTIAYLSCSPETLLRDLAALGHLGYRTAALTPFDMLPHTPHLEALAVLTRR
jgi:23S rRNA (uracil1939-C5)-methyltransferase